MSRRLFVISDENIRKRAFQFLASLPLGYRVLFQEQKRSTIQSDKMWAMLGDIEDQKLWHGQKLSDEDWKLLFMAGLNQELRIVPNLNGNGFVNLGRSSSKLSVREMMDLITLIQAWGDQNGVKFGGDIFTEKVAS